MTKAKQATAAIATLLGVTAFSLSASAAMHGGMGGMGGHGSIGGHADMGGHSASIAHSGGHEHFEGGHEHHHFRGRGFGGVGIYLGDDGYYDDGYYDDDYSYCYWRHGRRFCRY